MRFTALLRLLLGAFGLSAVAFGAFEFMDRTHPGPGELLDVGLWLAGAVVLHDGFLVPLVLGAGIFLARSPEQPVLRGGLLTAGSLTLIALPMMLRPGEPANDTVLPLDYPVNWLIALGATTLLTGCVVAVRRRKGRADHTAGAVREEEARTTTAAGGATSKRQPPVERI